MLELTFWIIIWLATLAALIISVLSGVGMLVSIIVFAVFAWVNSILCNVLDL